MRRLFALVVAAGCSGEPGPEPLCEQKVAVTDQGAWTIAPAESDPWGVPDAGADAGPLERGRCGASDMTIEDLNLEKSFTIVTRMCSYGTVEQPARTAVAAGDKLTVRVWYFSQMRFDAAIASVLVAFGDQQIWTQSVQLPAMTGGLLFESFAAPMAIAAGQPIRWHLSNHGTNSWNFLELSVTRSVPCSQLAKDGG